MVRRRLGELIPNFWQDYDIIDDVNQAVRDMYSASQTLETVVQIAWPNGTSGVPIQEQPLPVYMDTVAGVSCYSGQLFTLERVEPKDVQVATKVSGIPTSFYTKNATKIMSPQGAGSNTGDISLIPLNNPQGQDFVTVLGIWPVVLSNSNVTIWGTRYHPYLTDPQDTFALDASFAMGPAAYALSFAREKQGLMSEAARQMQVYQQVKQDFLNREIVRSLANGYPGYGQTAWPTLARGSSSVIFLDQNPQAINA
jgi:hypothetical protein